MPKQNTTCLRWAKVYGTKPARAQQPGTGKAQGIDTAVAIHTPAGGVVAGCIVRAQICRITVDGKTVALNKPRIGKANGKQP